MKTKKPGRGKSPVILSLDSGYGWVVNFTIPQADHLACWPVPHSLDALLNTKIADSAESKSAVKSLNRLSQEVSSCSDSSKSFLLSQYSSSASTNAVCLNDWDFSCRPWECFYYWPSHWTQTRDPAVIVTISPNTFEETTIWLITSINTLICK